MQDADLFDSLFNSRTRLSDYRDDVWRVVESQEYAATLSVVDDHAEQELLEQLLDDIKPPYREGTEGMHYLLKTAFRYPPLKWGSRFGTCLMPSYFYASEAAGTALCECAYYRFLFLQDMVSPYLEPVRSEYSVFKVLLSSGACLDLTKPKFKSMHAQLSDPASYAYSQQVGQWADEQGKVEIIRFSSARAPSGINVAVAKPAVIRSRKPSVQQRWLCLTKPDSVSFSSRESEMSYLFRFKDFCSSKGRFLRVS